MHGAVPQQANSTQSGLVIQLYQVLPSKGFKQPSHGPPGQQPAFPVTPHVFQQVNLSSEQKSQQPSTPPGHTLQQPALLHAAFFMQVL